MEVAIGDGVHAPAVLSVEGAEVAVQDAARLEGDEPRLMLESRRVEQALDGGVKWPEARRNRRRRRGDTRVGRIPFSADLFRTRRAIGIDDVAATIDQPEGPTRRGDRGENQSDDDDGRH